MGGEFGALGVRVRRVLYYSLSQHEQRPWADSVASGLPNLARRFFRAVPIVLPGFLMSGGTYCWAVWKHEQLLRKNPKDFENDE